MTEFCKMITKILKKSLIILRAVENCFEIFSSVQFSRSVVSDSMRPHESQHARPPCYPGGKS